MSKPNGVGGPGPQPASPHATIQHLRIARLPIQFWIPAVVALAVGVGALPWVIGDAQDFFYQAHVLALVHVFTLGWITAAMMGVMYRYVPALTKGRLRFPALAGVQLALFLAGVVGMVTGFAIGHWAATAIAAAVMTASVVLFAMNMLACLVPALGRGVAERGLALAVVFLLAAAVLGLVLALDKSFGLLGGSVLTNLASHAHLAALGWVTMTICAVSYRMLPAFLLPQTVLPPAAGWQLGTLAVAVVALSVSLLGGGGTGVWAGAIALNLLAYAWIVASMVRSRQMPIDWTVRHALAGACWLLAALALGATLAAVGGDGEWGNRVAGAYGAAGLLGWVSNLIVGMSYRLVPGLVLGARAVAGLPPLSPLDISCPRPRPLVFAAWNGGLALLAAGLLAGGLAPARVGASVLAAGGLTYAALTAWTLSFALRRAARRSARNPLRVLGDEAPG
ncbi:MAG: hypothetical protein HYY35_06240 [Deltaproteobacteria bacterium]|nr:hypothetical protein [Deltaproteobacteria bacterium]